MKNQNIPPQLQQQIDLQFQTALQLHQVGKLKEAYPLYKSILNVAPNHAGANQFLGVVSHQLGDHKTAEKLIKKALKLNPKSAQALTHLGSAMLAQGKTSEARSQFYKATKLQPDYAEAHVNLGVAYQQFQELDQALKSIKKAIKLSPKAGSYNILGSILRAQGKLEEAISAYNQAIKLNPQLPEAYNNLGNVYVSMGNDELAIDSFNNAIDQSPNYAEAHFNIGQLYQTNNELHKAGEHFASACQISPDNLEFLAANAINLLKQGKLKDAHQLYDRILAAEPSKLPTQSSLLLTLNYTNHYSQKELYEFHKRYEQTIRHKLGIKNTKNKPQRINATSGKKIRVGYVSADFRVHSVAYFFEALLNSHDKGKFEVYCYYNKDFNDAVTNRIKSQSCHWRDVFDLSDSQLAKAIEKDKIDILVDLAGHTAGNRLATFLYRPAPIQISWLGYPNTTGLSCMDFRITDNYADAEGDSDQYHSETLLRMPDSFLCYQGDTTLSYQASPPCKQSGHTTFGSFNNLNKITDQVIKTWAKILNEVPDSRLLLKCKLLESETTQARLLKLFEEDGIDKSRITFKAKIDGYKEHMELYNEIDIGLDPFPYNGTTTTFEALWMGVPTLTICGDRHASRVGTSIMSNIGLNDFVCDDKKDYVRKAKELAGKKDYLESIRHTLRQKLSESKLCDSQAFAKDIEQLYSQVIEKML